MSRFKLILLGVFAALAVGATGASAAFAADAGQELTKVPTKTGFSAVSGVGTLKAGTSTVTCKAGSAAGKVATKTTVKEAVVKFTECESAESKKACKASVHSKGAGEGEVVTTKLKGELGENESTETTTLLLKPEVGTEFVTLEANGCTIQTKVTGSVAGEVTETNKNVAKDKLEFKTAGGKQSFKEFENAADTKSTASLKAFGVEATEETSDENTFEEAVEVKSGE
jgi:hypothetical protein